MNLIKDPWLPIARQNGTREKISIRQQLDEYHKNPVTELEAPRPDFRNALYQLLIGIVQVAAAPFRV
jgi:CRISPR system Cascade subunit CasA